MLGCSYEEGKEFYTLEELAARFKLEHLNKAPAVFDYKKLEYFNANYIRQLSTEDLGTSLHFFNSLTLKSQTCPPFRPLPYGVSSASVRRIVRSRPPEGFFAAIRGIW